MAPIGGLPSFSILERIDLSETFSLPFFFGFMQFSFSILERIDLSETSSPSSCDFSAYTCFQYPRTDRLE